MQCRSETCVVPSSLRPDSIFDSRDRISFPTPNRRSHFISAPKEHTADADYIFEIDNNAALEKKPTAIHGNDVML